MTHGNKNPAALAGAGRVSFEGDAMDQRTLAENSGLRKLTDAEILRLQFIAEIGDALIMAGAAVTGAAFACRVDVLEMALRAARASLNEGIREFKQLGGANE
jgi:hypothetical protein